MHHRMWSQFKAEQTKYVSAMSESPTGMIQSSR